MEFRILGPIEVRDADRVLPLGAGQQRALLALLLLQPNETISRDRLIDELWGADPPATAAKALQGHVSALRRLFDPGRSGRPGDLIVTHGSGYELRIDRAQLDLGRFELLRAEGLRALADGQPELASARLREALELWRGPPLADLAYESWAQGEIARLEELRIATLEDQFDADLASGRRGVAGELEAVAAAHPLRERLRGQLMLALYRAGRQAEALAAYRETRRVLVDELGIEPSPGLQQLEQAILRQDPSLDREPATAAPRAAASGAVKDAPVGGPLVGRHEELGALLDGLGGALAGRGRLFLIAGEPGMGKSRLADELAARASAQGVSTLVGRAWEAGGAPAYWPWVQALRSYVRDLDPGVLRSQLGAGAPEVAQMLPELRDLIPDVGTPAPVDPEGARFRLFDATTSFLRRAAERQPLVLILDDLHAADTPSLLLLAFVAQHVGEMPILVVAAYRDSELDAEHPLSATLADVARHSATQLQLAGLSQSAVARLIEANYAIDGAEELVLAVHRGTEGNPLFVVESLRLLAAEGRLGDVDAVRGRIIMPANVRDTIMRRLGRLSPDCKQVLTLASVVGREFDLDVLTHLSGRELDSLLDLVDEASLARVVGEVPGGRGRLRFTHVLIRDTLYDGVSATRRIRLHRQVGESLEVLYSTQPEPHLAELAYHFREALPAGDATRAVDYARRAGERAARLLAYEEAARLFRSGIEIVESHAIADRREWCDLVLKLGDVEARAGNVPTAKEAFLRAAEIAREGGLGDEFASAALGYGGRFVWARAWGDPHLVPLLEEALGNLRAGDSPLRVRLLARLSGGPLRDIAPADVRIAMSDAAVEMARRLGDPSTLGYALDGRYNAYWGPDALESRLAIASELIEVAEGSGDLERAYAGHDDRFFVRLEAGDIPSAYREHEIKARFADELRQPAQIWDTVVSRALLRLLAGEFDEAEATVHEALELGRPVYAANAQLAFDLQTYALRREQGRLAEIADVVERAVDGYPAYPVWRYVLVDVLAELGRKSEAQAALDSIELDVFPIQVEMQWLFSLSLLPEACRFLGDEGKAAAIYELLRPYDKLNATLPPELCRGAVARGLGILAGTMSMWEEAIGHFDEAIAMNDRMGARAWLAHTRYDYAFVLATRGRAEDAGRTRDLIASATTLAHRLGMPALSGKLAVLSAS